MTPKRSSLIVAAVALSLIAAGCGGGSGATVTVTTEQPQPAETEAVEPSERSLLERAPRAVDGPSPNTPIAESALGNEKLEKGELEARIGEALSALKTEQLEWTVSCNSPKGKGVWFCVYFSRIQAVNEAASGRGEHLIESEWLIDQSTGEITEAFEREGRAAED